MERAQQFRSSLAGIMIALFCSVLICSLVLCCVALRCVALCSLVFSCVVLCSLNCRGQFINGVSVIE